MTKKFARVKYVKGYEREERNVLGPKVGEHYHENLFSWSAWNAS